MNFLKRAAIQLALLLASGTASATPTLQQIEASSKKAAETVAAESHPIPEGKEMPEQWNLKGVRMGIDAMISYSIPLDFNLRLDGTLEGYGFRWKIGDDYVYYKNRNLGEYLGAFKGSYENQITMGGILPEDIIDIMRMDYDSVDDEIQGSATKLQDGLLDIYNSNYAGRMPELLSIISGASKDTDPENLHADNIAPEDEQEASELMETFSEDVYGIISGTAAYQILSGAAADPMSGVSIGGNRLSEFQSLLSNLGRFVDIDKKNNEARVHIDLQGQGILHGELSQDYDLDGGRNFTHGITMDYGIYGRAYLHGLLKYKEGEYLYAYANDDELKLTLEDPGSIAGIRVQLWDVNLGLDAGYEYESFKMVTESFLLEEATPAGKSGNGIIYTEMWRTGESQDIRLEGQIDTKEGEIWVDLSSIGVKSASHRTGSLVYHFEEGQKDNVWYYWMLGAEPYSLEYSRLHSNLHIHSKSLLEDLINGNTLPDTGEHNENSKDYGIKSGILGVANISLGGKGKILSPFFTYAMYPGHKMRIGAIFDTSFLTAKFAGEMSRHPSRLRIARHDEEPMIASSASVTLLDRRGQEKIRDYYIKSEKIEASPTSPDMKDNREALARLCSDLDGILITGKATSQEIGVNMVLASSSPFYLGAGYYRILNDSTQAGEALIGYGDFTLSGTLGKREGPTHHGKDLKLSLAGEVRGVGISAELFGIRGMDMEEDYYKKQLQKRDVYGSINISGVFDEAGILKMLSGKK